jgi:hypothetical protein
MTAPPTGEPAAMIMGVPAEVFTAAATFLLVLATLALAIPTIFLAVAAWRQLPLLRDQLAAVGKQISDAQIATSGQLGAQRQSLEATESRQIETNTLSACERYYTNYVLHLATKNVFESTNNGRDYKKQDLPKYEHDLLMSLNYLNGLAVGVREGLLSRDIVRDNLHNTIVKAVDIIIPALIDRRDYFEDLIKLRDSWKGEVPYYRKKIGPEKAQPPA